METRILSANLEDGDLVGAIQAIAAFLKVDCTIETRVILSTESKKLIEMVDVLNGQTVANKPVEVCPVKVPGKRGRKPKAKIQLIPPVEVPPDPAPLADYLTVTASKSFTIFGPKEGA